MATKALGKRGQWANCKHMYYLFTVVCGLHSETDTFMHAASFSFNEVKRVFREWVVDPPYLVGYQVLILDSL